MGKFTAENFKILVITVLIAIGLIVFSLSGSGPFFSSLFGTVSAPVLSVTTEMTEGAREFVNLDGMTKAELKAQYIALSEENRLLREQLVDYFEMKEENASYENILSVKEAMPDLGLTAAGVVGRDPGDLFYDFTINRGTLSGVSKGDAVITEMGIVGVVEEAYATSSRVRSILSEDTQIGAVVKECGESGVIRSNIQLADDGRVYLDYLEQDTQVRPGAIVTTSGTGGMFPTDLLIGRVAYVERDAVDSGYHAVVVPYVDVKTVSDVFVITSFDGKGDLTMHLPTPTPEPTAEPEAEEEKDA
ncbi:MAG: rod shape-determining protein MreC [Clostridia bacterium]|nr:rod shape-determining protein MreC [Clostridia bacterium]